MNKTKNFHKMVGYQIYPKSFKDSNDDGFGDIQGIIEKLPYLKKLGIDFIWINPIYKSPQIDGGYDISDFYAIDEMFGTMDDFKKLLQKAHDLDLKIIMDLVVNHTSDQHPWFIESRKSLNNSYRDFYHWIDEPNDWKSFFGGSTWTFDETTKQYYFHVFGKSQPDLNWKNPKVREAIYKMVRFWLSLGIDGFRLDAISHIQKENWDFKITSWEDNGPWQPFMNVAGIEQYLSELKTIFDEFGALTVGEASGVLSSEAPNWTNENGYLDMIFELEHNVGNLPKKQRLQKYKSTIIRWQKDMEKTGWNALYLENHDNPRIVNVLGDGSQKAAAALAVSYMLLRGTPFIYQGQEIGMTNFPFTDISQLSTTEDLVKFDELVQSNLTKKQALTEVTKNSRDHSRTPFQWNSTENAGFTAGKPWKAINPNHMEINVEKSSDLIKLYQALIKLRHEEPAISDGSVKFYYENHPKLFAYQRDGFLIIVNLSETGTMVNFDEIENYQQILGSKARKLKQNMRFEAWEYQVFKKLKRSKNEAN